MIVVGHIFSTGIVKMVVVCFLFMANLNIGEAYTGPISLDGINNQTHGYNYLRYHPYHPFESYYKLVDFYISNDGSVLVGVNPKSDNGYILYVDLLKPGPCTNRDIQVGMTLNDLKYAYGAIYPVSSRVYDEQANTGSFYNVAYSRGKEYDYTKYTGYQVITYQEPISSLQEGESADGVEFVVNRRTNRIALIHYYGSMHKQLDVIMLADRYGLLPVAR